MTTLIKIDSYEQLSDVYSRCRKPLEGKMLSGWLRARKYNDEFILGMANWNGKDIEFATLSKDNILEFTADVSKMRRISITLAQALHRAIGIRWNRIATGRYELVTYLFGRGDKWANYKVKSVSEFKKGLKINIVSGEILNPYIRNKEIADTDARKVWLRSLREYKKGLKARVRLGVLDTIINTVLNERNASQGWTEPNWFSDEWVDKLHVAIRDHDFNTDMLTAYCRSSRRLHWNRPDVTANSTLAGFDKVVKDLSLQLRTKFGVFKD
jgi:hypothetical protein